MIALIFSDLYKLQLVKYKTKYRFLAISINYNQLQGKLNTDFQRTLQIAIIKTED